MTKRNFRLPGIQDLSKEQEDARALPLQGQHLVIGGPGTGKSVIALLRAKRLHGENIEYVFLVFNRLLHQSTRTLFGVTLKSYQWQSWFFRIFPELTGKETPRLPPRKPKGFRAIEWESAIRICQESEQGNAVSLPHLIIDEGQDMPPEFYQCLAILGFENFFVVADQNQQITAENSSIMDLRNALGISPEEVIELKTNYRNSYPIARLAREFYTGDPASPPPMLPIAQSVSAFIPILYQYSAKEKINQVIKRVILRAEQNPSKLIGVITPDDHSRYEFYDRLSSINRSDYHDRIKILTHSVKERTEVDFGSGGILVINASACKGWSSISFFSRDLSGLRSMTRLRIRLRGLSMLLSLELSRQL